MQEPTHILAGIIIQKSFSRVKPRSVALGVTAVTAFLSHGFLDELSRITFHPADPDFHSVFWVTYHFCVLVTTIVFLCWWWKPYKWGIAFAALPDLDWVFIHGSQIIHAPIPFYRRPHMHDLLGYIYHHIPPFSWMTAQIQRLPNNRHQPWACLWEILLVLIFFLIIRLMTVAQRPGRIQP